MRTFAVALLFVLSLYSLLAASRADALSRPGLPTGMARPQPLPEGDDSPGDDKKDDDEEDEEEYRQDYRGLSQRAALELVDPGGADARLLLRIAALRGP